MTPHLAPAEPPSPANQAAEDAQYYRGVLHELIDMGTDLARLVHGQAKAQAEAATAGDGTGAGPAAELAVAFDRIARAVRRSISLARTLSEPVRPRAAVHRTAARKRIIREVEDVIQRKAGGSEAEALHEELLDRLDAPDLDDDIRDRPVADIVADICRDLGIAALPGTRPWKRRGPAELATLWARATMPRAARPSGAGAYPSLAVVPPPRNPAAGDPSPGLTGDPTTPLLNAARFRGK